MRRRPMYQLISGLLVLICVIAIALSLIYMVNILTPPKQANSDPSMGQQLTQNSAIVEPAQPVEDLNGTYGPTPDSFDEILAQYNQQDYQQTKHQVNDLLNRQLKDHTYLELQDDIIAAIQHNHLNMEIMGGLFLPQHPSRYTKSDVPQLDIPLLIQKSPEWSEVPYGYTGTQQLAENGCAIATLTMVDSYFKNRYSTPQDIIDWAGNAYFTPQGTAWEIISDYAIHQGYQYINHGNHFDEAMASVLDGELVVVSVQAGNFTDIGHFMAIRGYDPAKGLVYLNDSNDNPKKMNSIQGIDQYLIINDSLNYWTLKK